jgi:hypothetical protein
MWLFDACSIINLSYCSPVAGVFTTRYAGRGGWLRAVQAELASQRARPYPHPQAGKALNWASGWLGMPIEIDDAEDMQAVEGSGLPSRPEVGVLSNISARRHPSSSLRRRGTED